MKIPFHRAKPFRAGERVKTPRFICDESKGFHYGVVKIYRGRPVVEWDEEIPYMSKVTSTLPAIHA
jgi:hypothetical protein